MTNTGSQSGQRHGGIGGGHGPPGDPGAQIPSSFFSRHAGSRDAGPHHGMQGRSLGTNGTPSTGYHLSNPHLAPSYVAPPTMAPPPPQIPRAGAGAGPQQM